MQRSMVGCLALLCVWLSPLTSVGQSLNEDLLEMHIKGVTMDPQGNTPVVILAEPHGHRAFPIWIGLSEARAIVLAMEGVASPRPLTHMLLRNILADLKVEIVRVVITDIQNNTFYATIILRQAQSTLTIDARPSDAIALALQANVPVFVTRKLLDAVHTVALQEPPSLLSTKALGMHVQSLDATLASVFHLASTDGVLVSSVAAGGQAERQGMRRGDVITSVDGKPVRDLQDFLTTCKDKKVGQEVVLQVTRDRGPVVIRLLLSSLD